MSYEALNNSAIIAQNLEEKERSGKTGKALSEYSVWNNEKLMLSQLSALSWHEVRKIQTSP